MTPEQYIYDKKRGALKGYCLGKQYFDVLRALTFGEDHHTGKRKDNKTPEFQHQIEIALYATTLKGLSDDEESQLLQLIMLHDVQEDYNVPNSEIEKHFGSFIAEGVCALNKYDHNRKREMVEYMQGLLAHPLFAMAKGCDRVHNVQSMRGVFTWKKQAEYVQEVREYFFPLLKRSRDLSPQHRQAFNNIKHMLQSQLEWVEYNLQHQNVPTSHAKTDVDDFGLGM